MDVHARRAVDRRRQHRQREKWYRGHGAPGLAERSRSQRQDQRGAEQQQPAAEEDDLADPAVEPGVGNQRAREPRKALADPVAGRPDPQMPDPGERDPAEREHRQQRDDPGEHQQRAQPPFEQDADRDDPRRHRQHPERPPRRGGAEHAGPAQHAVQAERRERHDPQRRTFAHGGGDRARPRRAASQRGKYRDLGARAHATTVSLVRPRERTPSANPRHPTTSNATGEDIPPHRASGNTTTPIPSQLAASVAGSRSIGLADT